MSTQQPSAVVCVTLGVGLPWSGKEANGNRVIAGVGLLGLVGGGGGCSVCRAQGAPRVLWTRDKAGDDRREGRVEQRRFGRRGTVSDIGGGAVHGLRRGGGGGWWWWWGGGGVAEDGGCCGVPVSATGMPWGTNRHRPPACTVRHARAVPDAAMVVALMAVYGAILPSYSGGTGVALVWTYLQGGERSTVLVNARKYKVVVVRG